MQRAQNALNRQNNLTQNANNPATSQNININLSSVPTSTGAKAAYVY